MKTTKQLLLICCVALLFLAGCVVPQWKEIQKPELVAKGASYKIDAPVGWIHLDGIEKHTFITREGPSVQGIRIEQQPKETAFETVGITVGDDVLISELAKFYVAEFKAVNPEFQVDHKGTVPFTLDGKEGFRATIEFRNEQGLVFDLIACGLMYKGQFYSLVYYAPRPHFFGRDLPVFEQVVASFTII